MSELRDERDDLRKLADQHEWEIADLRTKLEAAEKERDAALAKVAELRRLLHEQREVKGEV